MVQRDVTVCIDAYPPPETRVFRITAADEITRLLADDHESEFTIADLVDVTDATRSTVWRAVSLLEAIGVVRVRETPQRNYVRIDPTRLNKDDPILAIEDSEFHQPVRAFVDRLREKFETTEQIDLCGVVVFGSVARGEADRRSDIDLFVLIEGDRTQARRLVADVVSGLAEQRFNGDRFSFEPYVESVESARRAGGKLREIMLKGITVQDSEQLQAIRKGVIHHERS